METLVGKVKHHFPHVPASVVALEVDVRVGDFIVVKSKSGEERLRQEIHSMQVDHKPVQSGKAGEEVAIKVEGKTKPGDLVYREG